MPTKNTPLRELDGWLFDVRCRCGSKHLPIRLLLRELHPDRTAGDVARRLRCRRCRRRPDSVTLLDDGQIGTPGYVSYSGRKPVRVELEVGE